jgi:hypothetical protein
LYYFNLPSYTRLVADKLGYHAHSEKLLFARVM